MSKFLVKQPVKVGIVGTGYAASKRAEALQEDGRTQLQGVAGYGKYSTETFAKSYSINKAESWQDLIKNGDIDLLFICNANREHAAIAHAALTAGKHVVVEYPLALNPLQAEALINLAQQNNLLLHVEHIELLGGVHKAIGQYLPEIGEVFRARYSTITPQNPAPQRWTYNYDLFGFPLTAALSRLTRFTDLFGTVETVNCESRFWEASEIGHYRACLCEAQLKFKSGLSAQITYGKGEVLVKGDRNLELYGEKGALIFVGENGTLITKQGETPLEVQSRKGLFALDTRLVLDHILEGKPLYVDNQASYYALRVADAARESSETGKIVKL